MCAGISHHAIAGTIFLLRHFRATLLNLLTGNCIRYAHCVACPNISWLIIFIILLSKIYLSMTPVGNEQLIISSNFFTCLLGITLTSPGWILLRVTSQQI